MKRLLMLFLTLVLSFSAFAVDFGGLALSDKDQLLFQASIETPSLGEYHTLFLADPETKEMSPLSFYPDQAVLVGNPRRLQIQNRFGVFRSDESFLNLRVVETFEAFQNGAPVNSGRVYPLAASPDGRFLLFQRSTSAARGDLVLLSVEDGTEAIVSKGVELQTRRPAGIWSPNSRYFVYEKEKKLHYFSMGQWESGRLVGEEFRVLGTGGLANAQWSGDSNLYFLNGSRVYRILSREFFTRSLYADLLEVGEMVGKLPFEFDPNFDSFTLSFDGTKILLEKGHRNLFLIYLAGDDYLSTDQLTALPYLFLSKNSRVRRVLWSKEDVISVLVDQRENGKVMSAVYRMTPSGGGAGFVVSRIAQGESLDMALSPDRTLAAIKSAGAVSVRNYSTWDELAQVSHERARHLLWADDETLVIAGDLVTEVFSLKDRTLKLASLSQVSRFGFSQATGAVVGFSGSRAFVDRDGRWVEDEERTESSVLAESRSSSVNYRVYLKDLVQTSYRNMIMVRSVQDYGTEPLFPGPSGSYEPFPEEEELVDFDNFSHGSRIRRREVSLVFNGLDSVEGLTEILNVLTEYQIRATFFLNGEFIRRHPEAVAEIADSGHEMGSLFFARFDMTDAKYNLDEEFILKGLARNEDEYFQATGRELSLLWHAPYYAVSRSIIDVARGMNYSYIGRDLDPLDWVPKTGGRLSSVQIDSTAIVERILEMKRPGSVIPIRIGIPEGGRDDYLFQRLDLLIDGLWARGYDIVTVNQLREHAR